MRNDSKKILVRDIIQKSYDYGKTTPAVNYGVVTAESRAKTQFYDVETEEGIVRKIKPRHLCQYVSARESLTNKIDTSNIILNAKRAAMIIHTAQGDNNEARKAYCKILFSNFDDRDGFLLKSWLCNKIWDRLKTNSKDKRFSQIVKSDRALTMICLGQANTCSDFDPEVYQEATKLLASLERTIIQSVIYWLREQSKKANSG